MTDPVAILTGKEELEVDDGDRATPDAPAREPSQEEVPHDEGIDAQMAKKQGPWPASNRTQVERDAMWRAAPGAEDPVNETEDVSPVPPKAMESLKGTNPPSSTPEAPAEGKPKDPLGVIEGVEEMVDRANQDLDVILHLRDELEQVATKARKLADDNVSGPETVLQRLKASAADPEFPARKSHWQVVAKLAAPRHAALRPAQQRVARILTKVADWPKDGPPKGIGLPTEVRPANQAFIDELNNMAKAADDWVDQGWWYEKEFPLPADKRSPFKTALFLKMATCGERCHQFTTADTNRGVMVKVDRTEKGFNPQFTKMANEVYETFDPAKLPVVQTVEQRKVAGEIKALIVRKVQAPREAHICPHCEQEIGEKETFWPEEYRNHPNEMIMEHRPCGGLHSKPLSSGEVLAMMMPGVRPGEWHDHSEEELNAGPKADWGKKLDRLLERRGECPGCGKSYMDCTCGAKWPESAADALKSPGTKTAEGPTYPEAGEDAPSSVQKEIERFHQLPAEERQEQPLLYHLLGEGTPDFKMSKEDADYRHEPQGDQKCANCEFAYKEVVSGKHICSQVSGEIQPEHWCRLWKGPEQEKTAAEKPLRRRVEVIITDGLNVWGQKQRPQKGGVWFPGGGVDARDEKFADAAARETVEESGFEIDEIYRLARIKPCECIWDDSVIEQATGKWEKKAKQYRGDRTHLYVATVKGKGAPTSREGDAMPGEWMKFSEAIRKLRNAMPHDNQGWQPMTRARLRAVETLAPSGLKVPRRGEVEEVHEEVGDE